MAKTAHFHVRRERTETRVTAVISGKPATSLPIQIRKLWWFLAPVLLTINLREFQPRRMFGLQGQKHLAFVRLLLLKRGLRVTVDPSWLDSVDVNAIPVQVVGWQGEGVWNYPNLAAARESFPGLDPYKSTTAFTVALPGEVNNERALRFETWAAYGGYST